MTTDRHGTWRTILGWGLLLWVLSAFVTATTANLILVPTLVVLGSFLAPVTFVAWAFERRRSDRLAAEPLFTTFVVGGVLGVLAASVAESYPIQPSPFLHGLWEPMNSIAVTVTYLLTGRTGNQVQIFTFLSWTGLIVIAAAGVVFLVLLLRRRAAGHV